MAKRKITVTVDEELVEELRRLENRSMSSVVNQALLAHVERQARRAALSDVLTAWEQDYGAIGEKERTAARDAFDELDAAHPPQSSDQRDIA